MHWTNIGLILVAGLDLGMALLIWLRNPKHKINISFALAIFFLAIWTFGSAMFRESMSVGPAIFWAWMFNLGGIMLIVPFFLFSIYFPYQSFRLSLLKKIFIIFSILVVLIILFWPDGWFYNKSITLEPPNNNYQNNLFGYSIFLIYFLFYISSAYYNLFKKFLTSQGFMRTQVFCILISTGIISFVGTLFSALSPLIFQLRYFWIGPYFSFPMITTIIYFAFYYRK